MALAPLLYDITFDSQTRILYFWDKAGHEIYHCEIPSPVYGIPMGGMMSPTGHSTYYVQELPEQITVDNITLSGFMIPLSSLEEYFGNDQLEPESITIIDNDVIIPLYDFDVPVTDQSKLYGVMRLEGTGTGDVPTPTPVASFNNLDTLRQMGLVSLIYNGNHQLCLKFSCSGTGITFTGSMDSALIIAAIKQQMTVDNIGLHGMVGPMGGMMTEYVPGLMKVMTATAII